MITTFSVKLSILMILLDGCPICCCALLYGPCVLFFSTLQDIVEHLCIQSMVVTECCLLCQQYGRPFCSWLNVYKIEGSSIKGTNGLHQPCDWCGLCTSILGIDVVKKGCCRWPFCSALLCSLENISLGLYMFRVIWAKKRMAPLLASSYFHALYLVRLWELLYSPAFQFLLLFYDTWYCKEI